MSTWALINSNMVSNIISADQSFIDTIQEDYQYIVDISSVSPSPDIGWSYDGTNFSPPADNWPSTIATDLEAVHSALLQCLSDVSQASANDVSSGVSLATSNISSTFSTNESALWTSICNYVSSGG